jgi:hypothetical protein
MLLGLGNAVRASERLPVGGFGGIQGGVASGWTADLDAPYRPISVEVWRDGIRFYGRLAGRWLANLAPQVNAAPGTYRYEVQLPFITGSHRYHVYGIDPWTGKAKTLTPSGGTTYAF